MNAPEPGNFRVLSRDQHIVSRRQFTNGALKVLYRLFNNNYQAYLVGGAVRDLLDNRKPRDFDVVTSASLNEIMDLFKRGKKVGKRFPIVHVYFGPEIVEVTSLKSDGKTREEQIYEDAVRRDFTVNALYYDINNFQVIDPLGALKDLEAKRIAVIGDPRERFAEDPVRMLRAIKLETRLGYRMEPHMQEVMRTMGPSFKSVTSGRLYEEVTRMCLDQNAGTMLNKCLELEILNHVWPAGSVLMSRHDPDFFDDVREAVKVQYNRGGFSRETHAQLWFLLFMGTQDKVAKISAKVMDRLFNDFVGGLRMPMAFKKITLEALHGLIQIKGHQRAPETAISHESLRILTAYLESNEPNAIEQVHQLMKNLKRHPKKGRRRGRRGGKQRHKAKSKKQN